MRTTLSFVILSFLILTAGCQQESTSTSDGETVMLVHYEVPVPENWTAREPTSPMRIAEFNTPGAEGEDGGEVIAYYFGPGQGGSVEANIDRWTSQFTTSDGGPVAPEVTTLEGTTFPTTLAALEGTYSRGVGMGGMRDDDARPGQKLLAAVVETPEGNLFIQLFGPEASVEAQRDAFVGFLQSIQPTAQGEA